MKVCYLSTIDKKELGYQEAQRAVCKLLGGQEIELKEALKQLSVEKLIIEPLHFSKAQNLSLASQKKVLVQVTSDEESDVRLLYKLEPIELGGISVEFGPSPVMQVLKVSEDFGEKYSALAVLGEIQEPHDAVAVLCCNVDDSTGEELGWTMETLMENGAKDVFFTPIQMKKNRPAVMVSVVCQKGEEDKFCNLLFKHTSTIGVRWNYFERAVMQRSKGVAATPWGEIEVKHCRYGEIEKTTVEYESAKKTAQKFGCSVRDVLRYPLKNQ